MKQSKCFRTHQKTKLMHYEYPFRTVTAECQTEHLNLERPPRLKLEIKLHKTNMAVRRRHESPAHLY